MSWETLDLGMIGAFAAFVLLIVAAYNAISTAIKNYREAKAKKNAPIDKLATRADDTAEKLRTHDTMLEENQKRLDQLEDQQRIVLRALMAMLSHEINGNSIEKLQDSLNEIMSFLIKK